MKYSIMIGLLLFSLSLYAQREGKDKLQERYWDQLHPSDPLLNGREYEYYFHPHLSTPLIPKDAQATASAVIHDKKYHKLSLLYDTHKDLLVYYNPNTSYNNMITSLIVNPDRVQEFSLQLPGGLARFQYVEFHEDEEGPLSNGFYEIVREGGCKLFIDHRSEKNIKEGMVRFEYTAELYIIYAGKIFQIKGKKSLLKALSNHAVEVEDYLKRRKIRVRGAGKEQIAEVLDYYMELNHSRN